MTWGEALRLASVLAADPSSSIATSVSGWKYPLSREGIALLDLTDVQISKAAGKRVKPLPRPWDRASRRLGQGSSMTVDELETLLAAQASVVTAN